MKYLPSLPANPNFPRSTRLHLSIALLVWALLCGSPTLIAQSVTFAGSQTTLPATGLGYSYGIAVNAAGDVFVADWDNARVIKLPAHGGSQTTVTDIPTPVGLAVDTAGDLFIAAIVVQNIVVIPADGGPERAVGSDLSPEGVVIDPAGNVFIADSGGTRVVEVPAGDGTQTTIGSGWGNPVGVGLDSAGDLFVADGFYGDVVKIPEGGGAQTTVASGFGEVGFLAVDGQGDVFVSDSTRQGIQEVPVGCLSNACWISVGVGLSNPTGVALDAHGNLFIAQASKQPVKVQRTSVDFGDANLCAPGGTTPAPCSQTRTLTYNVAAGGTLRTPEVLTDGAPNLDFTRASGSTCAGAVMAGTTCIVNVKFTPKVAGERDGTVQIVDASGKVLATTLIYGNSDLSGFASIPVALNGSAAILGSSLALTNGGLHEVASAYNPTPVNVQKFTTRFDFLLTNARADGFTFTIQNAGPAAVGADGGSLGYAGIGHSLAIKFDLFQNLKPGEDPSNNSTGLFVDGAVPIGATSIDLNGTGINLHSGDEMNANLTYDGTTLTLIITDLVTHATWSHQFTINIPAAVGSNTAYVGFTAGTGGDSAIQQILDWTFE